MDTSETYIKMCAKAEEIQRPEVLDIHDYICVTSVKSGYKALLGAVTSPSVFDGIKEFVWLPRQDQWQYMWNMGVGLQTLTWCIHEFSQSEYGSGFTITGSMEQLWLAFVMKSLYSKIWNGGEWVVSTKAILCDATGGAYTITLPEVTVHDFDKCDEWDKLD